MQALLRRLRPGPLDLLLVAVPAAVVCEILHLPPMVIFIAACVAVIPLAGWMGRATEHLAARVGPGLGGLLNATFGNAAELIIAVVALRRGHIEIVKASLTGSIIGNVLLVLGLAFLLGGMKHRRLRFNATAAGMGATMLVLSAVGLLVPALAHMTAGEAIVPVLPRLSLAIAIVLFVTYILGLVFQLRTHQHLFSAGHAGDHGPDDPWPRRFAVGVLLVATVLIAVMSEILVGAVEPTAEAWGMSEVFVGVILVAVIGNAAEHSTAIIVAMKNQADLALNIAIGSGIQIALFVAPLLLFLSYVIAPRPMTLEFTPFEVVAVVVSVMIIGFVALDGESHWMEGALLLAVYIVLGIAFWYLPA